jgi:hypothetical protein
LERGEVAEAFKAGSIAVANEAEQEGVSFGRGGKQPVSPAAFGLASDGLDDAAVEAFDQAAGLRTVGSGQPVIDLLVGTDQIDVNEADRHLLEGADGGLVGLGSLVEAVANQTAMDGTARKLAVDATAHTSATSSSGNCKRVRSSQTSASSKGERLIASRLGVCERSVTLLRPRQRRTVVSLTANSLASSATDIRLVRM